MTGTASPSATMERSSREPWHALLLVTVCLLASGTQVSSQVCDPDADSTYLAAVVEYSPELGVNSQNARQRLKQNVAAFVGYTKEAKRLGAEIVVFPECALATLELPRLTDGSPLAALRVPSVGSNPCAENDEEVPQELRNLSCAARDATIYTVVNLPEEEQCYPALAFCPECPGFDVHSVRSGTVACNVQGRRFFNTNVAFDRKGTIVAKYRKFNLYGEAGFAPTAEPTLEYFDSDFGVRFGLFTSFDLMFEEPAVALITDAGVTDVIFPAAWFSELPFLTAAQSQAMWAWVLDVNFLAAGYNLPEVGSTGSGLYAGRHGVVVASMERQRVNKLLVGRLPNRHACSGGDHAKEPKELTGRAVALPRRKDPAVARSAQDTAPALGDSYMKCVYCLPPKNVTIPSLYKCHLESLLCLKAGRRLVNTETGQESHEDDEGQKYKLYYARRELDPAEEEDKLADEEEFKEVLAPRRGGQRSFIYGARYREYMEDIYMRGLRKLKCKSGCGYKKEERYEDNDGFGSSEEESSFSKEGRKTAVVGKEENDEKQTEEEEQAKERKQENVEKSDQKSEQKPDEISKKKTSRQEEKTPSIEETANVLKEHYTDVEDLEAEHLDFVVAEQQKEEEKARLIAQPTPTLQETEETLVSGLKARVGDQTIEDDFITETLKDIEKDKLESTALLEGEEEYSKRDKGGALEKGKIASTEGSKEKHKESNEEEPTESLTPEKSSALGGDKQPRGQTDKDVSIEPPEGLNDKTISTESREVPVEDLRSEEVSIERREEEVTVGDDTATVDKHEESEATEQVVSKRPREAPARERRVEDRAGGTVPQDDSTRKGHGAPYQQAHFERQEPSQQSSSRPEFTSHYRKPKIIPPSIGRPGPYRGPLVGHEEGYLYLKTEDLSNYATFLLTDTDERHENSSVKVCHGTFCCQFQVVMRLRMSTCISHLTGNSIETDQEKSTGADLMSFKSNPKRPVGGPVAKRFLPIESIDADDYNYDDDDVDDDDDDDEDDFLDPADMEPAEDEDDSLEGDPNVVLTQDPVLLQASGIQHWQRENEDEVSEIEEKDMQPSDETLRIILEEEQRKEKEISELGMYDTGDEPAKIEFADEKGKSAEKHVPLETPDTSVGSTDKELEAKEDRGEVEEDRGDVEEGRGEVEEVREEVEEVREEVEEVREEVVEDRGEVEEDRGEVEWDRGVVEEDRGVVEEDRGVVEEDRGVVEEDRGEVEEDRGEVEEDGGVVQEDRGEIEEVREVVEEDRGEIEEDRGMVEEEREVVEEDRGEVVEDREEVVEDRGEVEEDRGVVHEDTYAIGAIKKVVEAEDQVADEEVYSVPEEIKEAELPAISKKEEIERKESTTPSRYYYRLVVFEGRRSFDGFVDGGIQVCGIITCTDSTLNSCGKLHETASDISFITFRKVRISGRFYRRHALPLPSTLDGTLLPLPPDAFTISAIPKRKNEAELVMESTMPLNFLTFGIYSRNFANDPHAATSTD